MVEKMDGSGPRVGVIGVGQRAVIAQHLAAAGVGADSDRRRRSQ